MKKFYNREKELELLAKADRLKSKHSVMTMLIGRRRVGKTALTLQNYTKDKKIYLFVSKKDEHLLCEEFLEELSLQLDTKIFGTIYRFEKLFEYILELGTTHSFTLIIDEFQELGKINPSIYSSIQKLWDLYKYKTHIHLIACGSIYSLMKKIYEDTNEPLFGRADFKIDLQPFKVKVLKEILEDNRAYSNKNLLDFYTLTGGVAKYTEVFVLYEAFDFESMCNSICDENSLFLQEGKNRLIEEFGKEYGTYFSILSLIASSKTSRSEIESILERNISGHLARLENDYHIIKSIKPIGSKINSKVQKYEISDNFLAFWFRFIYKYQSLIEASNFTRLKEIIKRDFSTFQGKILEKLFIELLKDKQIYTTIGSYWERGNKNEIDIVAIDEIDKTILFCEVKLNPKRLNQNELILKSKKLLDKYKGFKSEYLLLSVDDIDKLSNMTNFRF
ncbi:ATP-binding protein [Hydrogenimonas thermophila]|uniref:ATP-binding protein n=1 Tax=Hydrogenimonas thermophila TaxID=223786 RepID=UPI0029373803|nr:ATP-binding protein [Hydrogenimonas thermophila]WOE71059.1 ATP-binding protein [Hydrogenimonas thermophila]WOE73577.1 ATP-binding protein [Hydrogenimonas thermophila]